MISYIKWLALLRKIIDNDLAIDLIFQSLLDSYDIFITNYLMGEMEKSIPKLLRLLSTVE